MVAWLTGGGYFEVCLIVYVVAFPFKGSISQTLCSLLKGVVAPVRDLELVKG